MMRTMRYAALAAAMVLAACHEGPMAPATRVGEAPSSATELGGRPCPTSLDPNDTSCLQTPGVMGPVGLAGASAFAVVAPDAGSGSPSITGPIKVAYVASGPDGAYQVLNQTLSQYGLGTITFVSVSQALSGALASGNYNVIVLGRIFDNVQYPFARVPNGLQAAIDAQVSAGVGFLAEWHGNSVVWSALGGQSNYYQMTDQSGQLWGWFSGAVDRGDPFFSPWVHTLTPAAASHPVTQGLPSSFPISGLEFCFRIQNPGSGLTPLATVSAGQSYPTMLAGQRGAGRVVLWACDWGDNGGGDATARLWAKNALQWVAGSVAPPNTAPTANAGADQTVSLSGSTTASVTLSGSGTDDGKPGPLSYTWKEGAASLGTGATLSVTLGLGVHTITLVVSDGDLSASDNVVVTVVDPTPPAITPSVSGTLGSNGWYTSNVAVSWTVADAESAISSTAGCTPSTLSTDSNGTTHTCSATSAGGTSSASVTVKRDATIPTVTYAGASTYTVDQTVAVTCTAADNLSGVASSTCANASGPAYTFPLGTNNLSATATDKAGNAGSGSFSFTVSVTTGSLCNLVRAWVANNGIANSLCVKLQNAEKANTPNARAGMIGAFINEVQAQSGKALTADRATILIALANAL